MIDTGAFYAKYVARDAYHDRAVGLWERVRTEQIACVTTNFIVEELITLLIYRFGTAAGLKAAREIYASPAIRIVPLTVELEMQALAWLERFQDQRFSMTDACSFAVMESEKLHQAFSFDRHFTTAGFTPFQ